MASATRIAPDHKVPIPVSETAEVINVFAWDHVREDIRLLSLGLEMQDPT